MSVYSRGWDQFKSQQPGTISDKIATASIYDGANTTTGTVTNSTIFNTPTGGSWATSPFSVNGEPTIQSLNLTYHPDQGVKAASINSQTKMANTGTDVPNTLHNFIYAYGNDDSLDYQMRIPISLGGGTFNTIEISLMGNSIRGITPQQIVETIRFTGSFTGSVEFLIVLSNFFGSLSLGIRAESSINVSTIYQLDMMVLSTQGNDTAQMGQMSNPVSISSVQIGSLTEMFLASNVNRENLDTCHAPCSDSFKTTQISCHTNCPPKLLNDTIPLDTCSSPCSPSSSTFTTRIQ